MVANIVRSLFTTKIVPFCHVFSNNNNTRKVKSLCNKLWNTAASTNLFFFGDPNFVALNHKRRARVLLVHMKK